MTEINAHATLVLFALARALDRDEAGAVGRLAIAARKALDDMGRGSPDGGTSWTSAQTLGVGVDEVTHRRFVVQKMGEMLAFQRDAHARADRKGPPPMPARYMAQALSSMLGAGPLRALYESRWTPENDGDADRILSAWRNWVASDGILHVDEDPPSLARKLVIGALVSLGVRRKKATDGLSRKALGKNVVSSRVRR